MRVTPAIAAMVAAITETAAARSPATAITVAQVSITARRIAVIAMPGARKVTANGTVKQTVIPLKAIP